MSLRKRESYGSHEIRTTRLAWWVGFGRSTLRASCQTTDPLPLGSLVIVTTFGISNKLASFFPFVTSRGLSLPLYCFALHQHSRWCFFHYSVALRRALSSYSRRRRLSRIGASPKHRKHLEQIHGHDPSALYQPQPRHRSHLLPQWPG